MPWSRLPTADSGRISDAPKALPDLLDAVLAGLGAPTTDAIVAIYDGWETIIGSEMVAHAHPVSIENGCLRVGVDSPAWASHLRWSEQEIIARVDRLVGPDVVRSVATRIVRR